MEFAFNPLTGELEMSGTSFDVSGKADKMELVEFIENSVPAELEIKPDTHYVIRLHRDLQITLALDNMEDGYSHAFIIDLITPDGTLPQVSFEPMPYFNWVKPLELSANKTYKIIIEDNAAMWMAVDNS